MDVTNGMSHLSSIEDLGIAFTDEIGRSTVSQRTIGASWFPKGKINDSKNTLMLSKVYSARFYADSTSFFPKIN